jgi:two-component system, sporulation sensor kinase D
LFTHRYRINSLAVDLYQRKRRWKLTLFVGAVVIVAASLWYTNILVRHIRRDERESVRIWADAIHRKADLVNFTNRLFEQIKTEERKRVANLAEAQKRLITATSSEDLTFLADIISQNTTIPVIQTDEEGTILSARNVNFSLDTVKTIRGNLMAQYSMYPPIVVRYYANRYIYLYYKDSNIFSELKIVLDDLIRFFFSEVVLNSASVPVIITDSAQRVFEYGNIPRKEMDDPEKVRHLIASMEAQNTPIVVNIAGTGQRFIYYKDSFILTQLRYYPIIQFGVIGIFLFIAYLMFSYARRSEQNRVWVGMAKETAHQLGTPLSSMVAWVELLKLKGLDEETVKEIEKDVERLETITDRFSKIGAAARLEMANIVEVMYNIVDYMKPRTSPKVRYKITPGPMAEIRVPINLHLFEWVIENLIKNAVDAMEGDGSITVEITEEGHRVNIDVTDTGKGISKSRFKTIFNPGYTSKSRGWGLGLTLSRRIIANYHSGNIFVKSSTLGKGTTFRISLKKKNK